MEEEPDRDYAYWQGFTFMSDQDGDYGGTDIALQDSTADTQPSETYLMGFVIANIVGLQHYSGTISGREMVGLLREPLNGYDSNAIKVVNTRTVQVGHIERSVAAVLAPLMDSHTITVEGIVPNTRAGGNKFKIPCQIHIFARANLFDSVKSTISRGGLVLISESNLGFSLSEAAVVKERTKDEDGRNVDEIFKLVDKNVREKTKMEALEPPKEVIKSDLFQHQKEGLGWLVHRENSGDLPPFWEENGGGYKNILTNYVADKRPEPLQGGIFADDMGLGKTLTLLSLIALDKVCSSSCSRTDIGSGSVLVENCDNSEVIRGKKRTRTDSGIVMVENCENADRSGKKRSRTDSGSVMMENCDSAEVVPLSGKKRKSVMSRSRTLIVCPPSVMSTWITQLEEHTVRGSLKMYLYYGTERTSNARELSKYDIVLTTYSILSTEQASWDCSPMGKIEWRRVILDEAHAIKNPRALQSKAVTNLKAKRRWVVTGTPIQNGSFDLFSLMAFLHFEPFSIKSYWQRLIQRPLLVGEKTGLSRLQTLMATISLRRTKDKALIELPKKTVETCLVDLSSEERAFYDQMEREAKNVVRECMEEGSLMRNYSTVLSIILRLRQICLSSVLCPPELKSILPTDKIEDASNNPELLKKILEVIQDGEDFDCPICISPPTDIIITCCAHIFCRGCILKTLRTAKSSCPLCRRPLSESDLFSAPPKSVTDDPEGSSSKPSPMSTKVATLLKLLKASRDRNPNGKSVVYSQFRKMLLLLEEPLKAAGFETLRLDGSMNAKKRAQVIEQFGAVDGPTILLASLKASGTGINLTAASTVYLMEPWWNPGVEEQAMDRIHRIGQKEDVRIVKLIARNSIEERVLELQEKKRKLATEAFGGGKKSKDRREVGLEDVRILMSL